MTLFIEENHGLVNSRSKEACTQRLRQDSKLALVIGEMNLRVSRLVFWAHHGTIGVLALAVPIGPASIDVRLDAGEQRGDLMPGLVMELPDKPNHPPLEEKHL